MTDMMQRQIDLESQASREGVRRYKAMVEKKVSHLEGGCLKPAERLIVHWLDAMSACVRSERAMFVAGQSRRGAGIYGPVLRAIEPERTAVVTANRMLSLCMAEPDGVSVRRVAYAIGSAIVGELFMDRWQASMSHRERWRELTRWIRHLTPRVVNRWSKRELEDVTWSNAVCLHTGAVLMVHMVNVASVGDYGKDFAPAFYHLYQPRWKMAKHRRHPDRMVAMTDKAMGIIEEGHGVRQFMQPRYLPMVVPPVEWSPGRAGGYIQLDARLVRNANMDQIEAVEKAPMPKVYAAVNALGATAWHINKPVLDVVKQLWDSGGGTVGVPHADPHPIPEYEPGSDEDWRAAARVIHRANRDLIGQRRQYLEKISVADQMKNRPFYLPHNIDFRGRAYPIGGALTHYGGDLSRGLLEFAEEKPFDFTSWAVHLSNCWGKEVSRGTIKAREEWAQKNAMMFAAASIEPLLNSWWMQADKPLQFLAACMGRGKTSRLPIQIDGTCNGLQHYAAMTRNLHDATVTNICKPSGLLSPHDAYGSVCDTIKPIIDSEAERGVECAKQVADLIDRQFVKHTVMSTVYGVTPYGAHNQFHAKLIECGFSEQDAQRGGWYLAKKVAAAMKWMFAGAAQATAWLKQVACIVTSHGEQMRWTTPAGMPVTQHYRSQKPVRLRTVLQSISMLNDSSNAPLDLARQRRAFAPNFVQSIDASHMAMSVDAARREGLTVASVHDSFWTHGCDIPKLRSILLNQFADLHRRSLLWTLHQDMLARHPFEIPAPPALGSYDIEEAREATYAFI